MCTIFNLLCPICTEVFHNGEEIHCTSCGHVLHYRCMQGWFDRSASCPQCRSPNPSTHRLYLSFDESAEAAANIIDLKATLDEIKLQVNGLKDDLIVKEEEIQILRSKQVELTSEYADSIEQKQIECAVLKENIASLEEKNKTQSLEIETLTKELITLKSSTDETIIELRNEISAAQLKEVPSPSNDVLTSNTSSDTTITVMTNEITKLKHDLENSSILLAEEVSKNTKLSVDYMNLKVKRTISKEDNGGHDLSQVILFKEKNKVLEQKLKHITSEFEKEINKSTQLEIDNMKLQNYVDCMKLNTSCTNNARESKNHLPNIQNMRKSGFVSSTESINSRKGQNSEFFDSSSNSIIIQKYPVIYLQYPLENVVTLIASNIGLSITKDDIAKVNIVRGKFKKLSELASLFVRFKTRELKFRFIANGSRLMVCSVPYLSKVQIIEYTDDRAKNLFDYANIKLKPIGFHDIFWTNNQVFAKRNISDPRGIRILNSNHVDELVKKKCEMPEDITFSLESLNVD